jgi:hypothetical protein
MRSAFGIEHGIAKGGWSMPVVRTVGRGRMAQTVATQQRAGGRFLKEKHKVSIHTPIKRGMRRQDLTRTVTSGGGLTGQGKALVGGSAVTAAGGYAATRRKQAQP